MGNQKDNQNYQDFSVGSDGEFVMTCGNSAVCVEDYLDKHDCFGYDEHGKHCTVEIRSGVSKNPLIVAQSIKKIMQKALNDNSDFADFVWNAGAFVKSLPIGFHFHAGHAKGLIEIEEAVSFLDSYLLAPSILLENRQQGLKRRAYNETPAGTTVSYGKISDYRKINNSKLERWEYRPISSVLGNEQICTAFLCLFKIVLFEYINNPSFYYRPYINAADVVGMNVTKIKELFPSIWSDMTRMILYPKFKKYLEIIPKLIKKGACWTPKNQDIKSGWNLDLAPAKNNPYTLNNVWGKYEKEHAEETKILHHLQNPYMPANYTNDVGESEDNEENHVSEVIKKMNKINRETGRLKVIKKMNVTDKEYYDNPKKAPILYPKSFYNPAKKITKPKKKPVASKYHYGEKFQEFREELDKNLSKISRI